MMSTFPAASIDDNVYLGVWVNRSYENVLRGATLTLGRGSGALLIAFIALFVSATGKAVWKIARFILHYHLSSNKHLDGVYHQRQAILSNSQTAPDAVSVLFYAALAWRKKARRSLSRLGSVFGLALFIWVGFSVAGLFSSRITAIDSNEVLLSSKPCLSNDSDVNTIEDAASLVAYRSRKFNEYITYTLQCYRGEVAAKTGMCETYPVRTFPYSMDDNASCPFSSEICRSSSKNVFLDTGLLDSQTHFGINTSPRFSFQYTRHCAPLVTEGYSEVHAESSNSSARTLRYFYGRANSSSDSGFNDSYTFEMPIREPEDLSDQRIMSRAISGADYKVSLTWTDASHREHFTPIPALDRPNTRLSLLFMDASFVIHNHSTEDPWFAVTTPQKDNTGVQYFTSSAPTGVLGCLTQVSICKPALPPDTSCAPLYPSPNLSTIFSHPQDLIAIQGALGAMLSVMSTSPDNFYFMAGIPSLLAGFSLFGPLQLTKLPPTQWQDEVEYNFQNVLASMQASMVEVATGKAPWERMEGGRCRKEDGCRKICGYQKIKSTRFSSFSVLGIVIVLVVGGLIMISAAYIESLASACLGRGDDKASYALLEWKSNATLQLQRLAHEELGLGTWSRAVDDIPVTNRGDTLGVWDGSDREHPRLKRPSTAVDDTELGFEDNGAIAMESISKAHTQSSPLRGRDSWVTRSTAGGSSPRSSGDMTPLLRTKPFGVLDRDEP